MGECKREGRRGEGGPRTGEDRGVRKRDRGRRHGQRVLSIHAQSQNPQIISLHCLEFEPRWKCEMTISEKSMG